MSLSPGWGVLAGVITLALLVAFLGIWIWAWRARHRRAFDALARLPMEDADGDQESTASPTPRREADR